MATKKKKAHRRPAVSIPIAARSATPASAIAALEQSAPPKPPESASGDATATAAPTHTPRSSDAGDAAVDRARPSAPAAAASPASTPPGSSSASSAKPKPTPPITPGVKPVALTGSKYNALNRDQLRTAAAILENENIELRKRVDALKPLAAAKDDPQLQSAIASTFGIGFDLLALKFGDVAALKPEQKETLGRAWAPVLAGWMGDNADFAKYAPLFFALVITSGIVTGKVREVQKSRADESPIATAPR